MHNLVSKVWISDYTIEVKAGKKEISYKLKWQPL